MENSQPLATESFSYSWLIDRNPSSPDTFLNNLIRPKFSNDKELQNFNFDFLVTTSPIPLVHADEIFSDGQIVPTYVERSIKTSTSVPNSPFSSTRNVQKNHNILGKWRKSYYIRILQKCLGFMRPLRKTIGRSRKSNRVDDLERKVCEVQSLSNSLEASPRTSPVCDFKKIGISYNGLKKVKSCNSTPMASPCVSPARYSSSCCDAESSIHEAILYCKRSIEK